MQISPRGIPYQDDGPGAIWGVSVPGNRPEQGVEPGARLRLNT